MTGGEHMKAAILHTRGADGVAIRDVDRPARPQGWALVRMLAASVNRVDLYMRDSGAGITHDLPLIMGVDGVGEIAETDEGSQFASGDRVILYPYEFCGTCRYCAAGDQPLCTTARIPGEHRDGTFAEYIALPEASIRRLPPGADIHQAAALGVAWLTAWRMVFGKAPMGPGRIVLVVGAGGGVSEAAAQLAHMAGARVIVTTSGKAKLDHFREMGIEAIDYREEDVVKSVMRLTGKEGADVVIDNVGEATWPQSLKCLARGGHIVTCGATTGGAPSAELQRLFIRQLHVHGSTMGSLEEFRHLIAAFEGGRFTPCIDSVYPLDQVPAAFARLEEPDRLGKIVIDIAKPG
jgi:NADPH:quinone reductase-like Zn-dependent oxidoreductase